MMTIGDLLLKRLIVDETLIGALIGAFAVIGAGVLTFLGVDRKAASDEATAYLEATNDLKALTAEVGDKIRADLMAQIAEIQAERRRSEAQLAIAVRANRKMFAVLREYVDEETLAEISDLPVEL